MQTKRIFQKILVLTLSTGMWTGLTGQAIDLAQVTPVGRAVGIRMTADGAMIISIMGVQTSSGEAFPARQAGLQKGDVIRQANGIPIDSNETLQQVVQSAKNCSIRLNIVRNGVPAELQLKSVTDASGIRRIGVMVRDSIAGIGTITFVEPDTGKFASLGHAICDTDTGALLPLATGNVMEASVTGVVKGAAGDPGALQGEFNLQENAGVLDQNTPYGVFGALADDRIYHSLRQVMLVSGDEAKTGAAQILANIDGESIEPYTIRITKIFGKDDPAGRGMMIEITDPKLLQKTGGIVQGMSGSPILQNGKLIGAVTHVLVNDPTKGYAIFAEKMYEQMRAS